MADTFTRRERSSIMRRVVGRGNVSTEQALVELLREAKLSGWRRHLPLLGNPDFVFPGARVAVFVDGCFWHSCPRHLRLPADNRAYWIRKIERNRRRDVRIGSALRALGWRVVRIWEHAFKGQGERARAIARVARAVGLARRGAGGRRAGTRAGGARRMPAPIRRGDAAGPRRSRSRNQRAGRET